MREKYKALPAELYKNCDPNIFTLPKDEENTLPENGIIGQERAVKAVEFGLRINRQGYNIFVSGIPGVGKKSYAESAVLEYVKEAEVPFDWVYVYNFEQPENPTALKLPPGKGAALSSDMDGLIRDFQEEIPKALGGEEYERQKTEIVKKYQSARSKYLDELNKYAEEQGFALKKTGTGFVSIPIVEGKQLSQEEYEELDADLKSELEKASQEVQLKALEIMPKLQGLEREVKEKIVKLEQEFALFAMGDIINILTSKYEDHEEVVQHLENVKSDALENLEDFREEDDEQMPFSWMRQSGREEAYKKYTVNVFVDHRETRGAPVVVENNPTYYNLVGRVEHESKMGMLSTDFTMVKAGAFHRANGGYLILQVLDVLRNVSAWEAVKRVLKTREVTIENLGESYGLVTMSSLRPSPISVDVKVVLIGSPLYYQLLSAYDEDFRKLFKVRADFDFEMNRDTGNVQKLAEFIHYICRRDELKPFNNQALARVVEYSSELAGDQEKLTTRFNDLLEVLYEADTWASLDNGSPEVLHGHVEEAIREKIYRSNRVEEKIQEEIEKGRLILDLTGKTVGQVNGLSVMSLDEYSFGRPARITATTYPGRAGVVNIERESRLSGRIHDKGVLILSGILGARYAKGAPLSLSAQIAFEQSYGGVDGDSASSAELYAIISSLAEIPLDQGIAVTGSVNQKGEIQPVGGINEKIEGHFIACKSFGLTGEQGVIIPARNAKNLMVNAQVRQAVEEGLFSIYTINHIDEGLEILTGLKAGSYLPEAQQYEEGTVHFLAHERIREYAHCLQRLREGDQEKTENEEK